MFLIVIHIRFITKSNATTLNVIDQLYFVYIETVKGNNSDFLFSYSPSKIHQQLNEKTFHANEKKILQWPHALIIKLEK